MKNLKIENVWYQVQFHNGVYFIDWATESGIEKGQYHLSNGIELSEKQLRKAAEISIKVNNKENEEELFNKKFKEFMGVK